MKPQPRHHGCRITEFTQHGHNYVSLESPRLRTTVQVTCGATIVEFRFKPLDIDVLWHSEREVPSRGGYFPHTAIEKDTFMDHFVGGWQESFPGGAGTGDLRGARLGLHGEVSLLEWEHQVVRDSAAEVAVEFATVCRRTPFSIRRLMSLNDKLAVVRIEEEIVNRGRTALEFAWGHHPAFGPPFLSPRCVVDLPAGVRRTRLNGDRVPGRRFLPGQEVEGDRLRCLDGTMTSILRAPPAEGGTVDNYYIEVKGDARAALRNPKFDLGVALEWNRRTFPYLWEWEVSHGCPGYPMWGAEYLMALEPFNCPIGGVGDLAGQGVLPLLKGGEKAATSLSVGFCRGRSAFRGAFMK